jgi:hypothetical protein
VNYWIEGGDYKTPPGECVRTENAYVNLESGDVLARLKDSSISLPRRDVAVKGLEDIRLYARDRFTATVQEYSEGVRVMDGRYNAVDGVYEDCRLLDSPDGRPCEKNWLPIGDTGDMIYDWHPFRVIGPRACTHPTSPFWSLLRGSAPPIRVGDEWWALTHCVQYSKPRMYYHCVVALDPSTYAPRRISLPFVFRSPGIEYCVSVRHVEESLECYVSFQDTEASRATIPLSALRWISV